MDNFNAVEEYMDAAGCSDVVNDLLAEIHEEIQKNGWGRYEDLKIMGRIGDLREYFEDEALGRVDEYLTDLSEEVDDFDMLDDFDVWRERIIDVSRDIFNEVVTEYFMVNVILANASERMCLDKGFDGWGHGDFDDDDDEESDSEG